ncbi:sortase [Candidatus Saccharibacteria bacterium]|nr:sortase [Candidatus Saccharibacteria bacterium]
MNPDTGGQYSDERQRQTAAEIARKKVLSAYNTSSSFAAQAQSQQQVTPQSQGTTSTYKNASVGTTVSNQDLQKYHSAWQNYYQKYYNDYYAKAAKQYIETEKLKNARAKSDSERLNAETLAPEATDNETITKTLRSTIQQKADSRFKLKKKHKKLIPALAGVFVVLFILFLQYNRLIFAPIMAYIAPGNVSDDGITAIDPTVSTAVSETNKLIIPKLNVDVPVHFGISNDTHTINQAMMNGVAHFMVPGASAYPGQIGNTVITGHSAGDIYSSNQYKFIFSGLERLVEGDLIYIDYNKVRYTYRMTGTKTVEPSDVESLKYDGDKAILTLITCWPLGTSRYRLLVFAEQISPALDTSTEAPTADQEVTTIDGELPKNENTFFENIFGS